MKICQICAVDFTLKKFLLPLVDELLNDNNEVISVCSKGIYYNELKSKYNIHPIHISRSFNVFHHLKSLIRIYFFFKKNNFDVIHVHTPVASIIVRIAAKLAGVKLIIYTAHGFYFHENMNYFYKKFHIFIEFIMGYLTDLIFTQSYEDYLDAIKYNFLKKNKIFYIGNGVNINKFNPLIFNDSNLNKNKFTIGFLGRIVKEKGIIEFLEAAEKIVIKYDDIEFLIGGTKLSSDVKDRVFKRINYFKKNYNNKIKFIGNIEDAPKFYSRLDLFCLPSWREGMPRTIIEAMMMKKCVIASNIRGAREEIINNETGYLFKIKSSEDICNAIIKCYKDKNLTKAMGVKGQKRALAIYDESKITKLQSQIIKNQFSK